MTIQARYSGVCRECGERWQPGDLIRSQAVGAERHEYWLHAACPIVPDAAAVRPGEVACPDCWLIHPEGACDR